MDPTRVNAARRQDTRHPRSGRRRAAGRADRDPDRHARSGHQAPRRAGGGVADVLPPERTDEVLSQSDFVLLLLPATLETDSFVNARRIAQMKPTAWLLNFGRGHLIVDADLIAAVQSKVIAGAVLDVFRQEPLPTEHPFWRTEGILVLPHIGGGHPQRDKAVAQLFAENLAHFLDGRPLRQVVDRAAGY